MGKIFVSLCLLFFFTASHAANYPLEIIQPREGLDTTNRFYKAYPGLEYNVRIAVIGGLYPFQFELLNAPAGMSIDRARGEIAWPSPPANATPYPVSVRVTDAEGSTRAVSWTITVTTTGFRFLDAVNGKLASEGGTGSITQPWKSFSDFYEGNTYSSKTARSYAGEFLYFRNGTYRTGDAYIEDGTRVPLVSNYKPQVWLAYPGENPVIDMQAARISIYAGGSNTYFDGLVLSLNGNARGHGITIDSTANNVTFRRNVFRGDGLQAVIGQNNSLLFITRAGVGASWAIQDNRASGVSGDGGGYWLLGYAASKVLVENNTITDVRGHSIGPKEGTALWFIRGNHLTGNWNNGINVQYSNTNGIDSGDIEIAHNYIHMPEATAIRLNSNQTTVGKPIYTFRNTFVGDAIISKATATNGVFSFYNNVIINGSTNPDKITRTNIDDPSRVISTNNLTGTVSNGIIDSNGNLTQAYSSYLGTHGHQISSQPVKLPRAPTNLNVIQ